MTPLSGFSSGLGAAPERSDTTEAHVAVMPDVKSAPDATIAQVDSGPGPAVADVTRQVFFDSFTLSTLTSGWTFTDDIGDSMYSLILLPGLLAITLPADQAHDCHTAPDCARMMRPLADARWQTITVDVRSVPSTSVQCYGLLLWQDASNYARLEVCFGTQGPAVSVDTHFMLDGVLTAGATTGSVVLGEQNQLRVVRSGQELAMMYSTNGGAEWNIVPGTPRALPLALSEVGVHVINAGVSPPTTTAVFDAFTVE